MGVLQTRSLPPANQTSSLKAIEDIYLMFEESNRVIMHSISHPTHSMTASRIKNIDNLLNDLLDPFLQQEKYGWGREIFMKFKKHFSKDFEVIWGANRQQFYELLLFNCNAPRENSTESFQDYFYNVSVHKIQDKIPNNYVDPEEMHRHQLNLMNATILMKEVNGGKEELEVDVPLFLPSKNHIEIQMGEVMKQIVSQQIDLPKQVSGSRMRVQNCSLLLPETVFVDRLSQNSEVQVSDLLKYYNQFVNTINQLFCSNNMISCPLKHFVFTLQEKILRKKIKHTQGNDQFNNSSNEQARKIRKTRELNNNILLYEVKSFLQAYNSFVWMYLQLHLMAESRLGKIINSEILYGIIFKSLWNFVDWIAERGFEFEESKLEEHFKAEKIKNQAKLPSELIEYYERIIESLRNEKHPQQYLKKVVIFYRQVSKNCQNADELLLIYQQILGRAIKQRGGKQLYLFRMRNIIEKLLKIDENSMSGGEISYSWTTWCILIELLRERINYQYGNLVISKESFNNPQLNETASFTIEQSVVRGSS